MTTYGILIVEDETIPAHYLKKCLEQAGHTVVDIVTNSKSAMHVLFGSQEINLVVMDIKIKGTMDGITLAQKIQQNTLSAILFTTAYADEDFLERAKDTNAIGYLVKPIQAETLLSTIEVGMSHYHAHIDTPLVPLCHHSSFDKEAQSITDNSDDSLSVKLSHHEALLLSTFIENPNLLYTHEQLESILESITPRGAGALRTILWRLRKKLPACLTIENIYNLGYRIKFLP